MSRRFDYGSSVGTMDVTGRVTAHMGLIEARTLRQRALGLTGLEIDRLPSDAGVLFRGCTCVHTFGMRGPVSLIWISEAASPAATPHVVSYDAQIQPNRVIWGPRGADGVIETAPLDEVTGCEEMTDIRITREVGRNER